MDVVKLPAEKANYIEEGSMLHTHVHPETDSHISAVTRPTGRRSASITSLYVPEEHRGKGIGKLLLNSMMNEFPSIQGQVSSKAAAKNAYKSGRRLAGNESASLEDVYKKIDEDSSANMWTHKADGGDVERFHGTDVHDLQKFDPATSRTAKYHYLTDKPETAQSYGKHVYRVKLKPKNMISFHPENIGPKQMKVIHELSERLGEDPDHLLNAITSADGSFYGSRGSLQDRVMDELKDMGHDAVRFPDVSPGGGWDMSTVVLDNNIVHSIDKNGANIHKADGGDVDGITAYHGSPYDFEQFDTSKIGTGEGAQAYGHGLYFAKHEPVAMGYRDKLAQQNDPRDAINDVIHQFTKGKVAAPTHENIKSWMADESALKPFANDERITRRVHEIINSTDPDDAHHSFKELDNLLPDPSKGHMYEVHINAHPHHMLDWDKPLSEQSEHVQNAIKTIAHNFDIDPFEHLALAASVGRHPRSQEYSPRGNDLYNDLEEISGGKVKASEVLQAHGIKGIKYQDAGSRGAGQYDLHVMYKGKPHSDPIPMMDKAQAEHHAKEYQAKGYDTEVKPRGTHNYVVFDHNDVRIKRKYERGGRVRFSQGGTDSYDYRGEHQAPGPEDGAPLHDLTKVYPDDVYGPNGFKYYGETGDPSDRTNFSLVQSMRGKPNASVTMYRAVPNVPSAAKELAKLEEDMANYQRRGRLPRDAWTTDKNRWYDSSAHQRDLLREKAEKEKLNPPKEIGINAGDWVTTNRQYAKDHGESALNGNYKILTKKAKAKELFTAGDSHHEWGYHPEKKAEGGEVDKFIPHGDPKREQNLTAFQKGNHPEVPHVVYHGAPDVRGIVKEGFKPFSRGNVFFATDHYKMANSYADPKRAFDYQNAEPHVIPLHLSLKNPMVIDAKGRNWRETERHVSEAKEKGHDGVIIKNSVDYYNNPKTGGQAGTVFAWFEPSQAKSAINGQLKSRVDNVPIPNAVENNGNFDPKNPDITKSTGGDVGHRVHFPSLSAVYD